MITHAATRLPAGCGRVTAEHGQLSPNMLTPQPVRFTCKMSYKDPIRAGLRGSPAKGQHQAAPGPPPSPRSPSPLHRCVHVCPLCVPLQLCVHTCSARRLLQEALLTQPNSARDPFLLNTDWRPLGSPQHFPVPEAGTPPASPAPSVDGSPHTLFTPSRARRICVEPAHVRSGAISPADRCPAAARRSSRRRH